MPPTATPSPAKKPFLAILLTLMLIEGVGMFEQAMVLGAIPFFAAHFQADIVTVSWVLTIFVLVGAGSAVVAGRLGDVYGRKRVLAVLLIVSILGSVISLVFGTLPAIIVGRALQGTSTGILPLLIGIARETVEPKRVPTMVAIISASASFMVGIGMLISGIFVDTGQWILMFATAAGLGLLALLLCQVVLPRPTDTAESTGFDWLGAVLLAPAVILVLFGLTNIRGLGVGDPLVLSTTGAGLAVLVFWIWWELRVSDPIVNLRFLLDPKITKTMVLVVFTGLGALSVTGLIHPLAAQLSPDLPIGAGLSATAFGMIALVGSTLAFLLSPAAGRFAARFGGHVLFAGSGGLAVLSALLLFLSPLNKQPSAVATAIVISSIASAFLAAAIYNLVVEAVPAQNTSEFVGLTQVVRNLMMAVGTAVGSALLASSVVPDTSSPTSGAWNMTMVYLLATLAIGIAVALTMRRRTAEPEAASVRVATRNG